MGNPFVKYSIIFLILLGGCNSDFHSKKWAESALKNRPGITIVKNFIDLGFAGNSGMIFGILNKKIPQTPSRMFIVVRIVILCALTIFIWNCRNRSLLYLLPFLLFWIGALGNLIDLFKYGYVVDFIHIQAGDFFNWPFYFNLADAYITIGVFLILFKETAHISLRKIKKLSH